MLSEGLIPKLRFQYENKLSMDIVKLHKLTSKIKFGFGVNLKPKVMKNFQETVVNPFLIDTVSMGISPLYPKLKATQLLLTRSSPVNQ